MTEAISSTPSSARRTAVVTGGARGLGLAFGRALAADGVHVVLVDLDRDEVEAAAAAIRADGGAASGYAGNVANEDRIAEIFADAAQIHDGIDLLVNNAGLHADGFSGPLVEMGLAKVRLLFEVNVIGVVVCTLAARPYMSDRVGANIINICSSAAHLGGTAYGTSKLAVAGLTLTFAREFGEAGIRVNAISPGLILTDTIRSELPDATKVRINAMQFIKGYGREQDIVDAMRFLASEQASFVTGETLRVGGGMGAGV